MKKKCTCNRTSQFSYIIKKCRCSKSSLSAKWSSRPDWSRPYVWYPPLHHWKDMYSMVMLIAAILVSPSSVIAPPHTRSGADKEMKRLQTADSLLFPFPTLSLLLRCVVVKTELTWCDWTAPLIDSVFKRSFCWISQANRMCRWPFGHKKCQINCQMFITSKLMLD